MKDIELERERERERKIEKERKAEETYYLGCEYWIPRQAPKKCDSSLNLGEHILSFIEADICK